MSCGPGQCQAERTSMIYRIEFTQGQLTSALTAYKAAFPSCANVSLDELLGGTWAEISAAIPDAAVEARWSAGVLVSYDIVSATSGRRFRLHVADQSCEILFGVRGSINAANDVLTALGDEHVKVTVDDAPLGHKVIVTGAASSFLTRKDDEDFTGRLENHHLSALWAEFRPLRSLLDETYAAPLGEVDQLVNALQSPLSRALVVHDAIALARATAGWERPAARGAADYPSVPNLLCDAIASLLTDDTEHALDRARRAKARIKAALAEHGLGQQ